MRLRVCAGRDSTKGQRGLAAPAIVTSAKGIIGGGCCGERVGGEDASGKEAEAWNPWYANPA